ncbi:MAG: restriction endonuclease subunit S, partial [Defluviitaleaceae bacterium]|nr:restriction endonuclease subunit S [Defluviitaleaceae bacterium]
MKAAELKKSILQAAVEGKLAPQDPNDEPASVLLERIKQEKEQLACDGKIKQDALLFNDAESPPYDLPDGWTWIKIDCIGLVRSSKRVFTSELVDYGIPFFRGTEVGALANGKKMDSKYHITKEHYESLIDHTGKPRIGDLLLPSICFDGRIWLVDTDEPFYFKDGRVLWIQFTTSLISNQYVQQALKSRFLNDYANIASGTTFAELKIFILKNIQIPLPPLSEQNRIVTRLNELSILCDELEQAEKELDVLENQFAEYLPKSILQAAVQGKLVAQDPNDEPATELLKRIKQEKEGLIRNGKIKKDKPLPPISEDEIPYDLPNGWVWCHLGELGETNIGLTYKPADISEEGIAVMRSSNVQDGRMDYNDVVYVKSYVPDKNMLQKGDILICARNGSRKLVGKTAIVDRDGLAFGAFMAMFRSGCNPYINAYFASPLFRQNMDNPQTTTINQITQDMLKKTLLPLPPLAEQQRIV